MAEAKGDKPEKKDPVYVVCRVGRLPSELTIIDPAVPAKTQDKAMEIVHDRITAAQAEQTEVDDTVMPLCAFLASGFRAKTFRSKIVVSSETEDVDLLAQVAQPIAAVPDPSPSAAVS